MRFCVYRIFIISENELPPINNYNWYLFAMWGPSGSSKTHFQIHSHKFISYVKNLPVNAYSSNFTRILSMRKMSGTKAIKYKKFTTSKKSCLTCARGGVYSETQSTLSDPSWFPTGSGPTRRTCSDLNTISWQTTLVWSIDGWVIAIVQWYDSIRSMTRDRWPVTDDLRRSFVRKLWVWWMIREIVQ